MSVVNLIKYHTITKNWGNTKFCLDFSNKINEWLHQFSKEDRPLMLELLKNFYYYTTERLNSKVIQLNNKFNDNFSKEYSESIFVGIEKKYNVSFSNILFMTYWQRNDLYDRAKNKLMEWIANNPVPSTISIIDDYSGTGTTFIKYIKKLISINDNIKKSHIFFLVLHISKDAQKNISAFAVQNGIDIKIVFLHSSSRAFEPNYIYSTIEAEIKKRQYTEICSKFKITEHVLGFEEIAALVSFEYNTPNNTLGIFWKELDGFYNLFIRHHKQRIDLPIIQQKAKQNKNFIGTKIIVQNIEEAKLNMFMVYCVAWGKSFSVARACYDFGLTDEQIDGIMSKLLDNNYLSFKKGRPLATNKMREYIFSSRIKTFKKIYYELKQKQKILPKDEDDDLYIPVNFSKRFRGY